MKTLSNFEQKSVDLSKIHGGSAGPSYSGGRSTFIACGPGGSAICGFYMEPIEVTYY